MTVKTYILLQHLRKLLFFLFIVITALYQFINFSHSFLAPGLLLANIFLNKIYYAEEFDDAFLFSKWFYMIVKVKLGLQYEPKKLDANKVSVLLSNWISLARMKNQELKSRGLNH